MILLQGQPAQIIPVYNLDFKDNPEDYYAFLECTGQAWERNSIWLYTQWVEAKMFWNFSHMTGKLQPMA